ncbi:hypothetical protein GCM10010104_03520 [Streptomyces indiaensis]|uniref:Uncharacterized protein n=1 Tax=Streptomyces indiaensis TaxID=284033 RepID=A0ABP6HDT5_9ACTN
MERGEGQHRERGDGRHALIITGAPRPPSFGPSREAPRGAGWQIAARGRPDPAVASPRVPLGSRDRPSRCRAR